MQTGLSFMRYVFEDDDPAYAWLASIAAELRPAILAGKMRLEVQGISNRYYNFDFRVLLSTNLQFWIFRK